MVDGKFTLQPAEPLKTGMACGSLLFQVSSRIAEAVLKNRKTEENFMIVRTATDADREAWDVYAAESVNTPPYYHYAWKDVLESSYNVRTQFFLAEDNGGTIRGIFPTYTTKTFRGARISTVSGTD